MRKLAWFLIVASVLALVAELCGFVLPTLSWAYTMSHDASYLAIQGEGVDAAVFPWFGHLVTALGVGIAVYLLKSFPVGREMRPVTKLRLQRFKGNRRGYISFWIIVGLVFVAGLDQLIVGKRALFVKSDKGMYFPAFQRSIIRGDEFGVQGDFASSEANYRKLKEEGKLMVVMPLVPYDPTQDTVDTPFEELREENGILLGRDGQPMNGSVSTLYDGHTESRHMVYDYRKGVRHGLAIGRDRKGEPVYEARYKNGKLLEKSVEYTGTKMSMEAFLNAGDGKLVKVLFHASPPSAKHLLGTTPQGNDMVAYLFGGLQVNIRAALVYIPMIYFIGVTIGLLMGFFGGIFDLVVQRLIEIFSTIPFLFVVIIFSSLLPADQRGLGMILAILILFGWMGMTYLMRTAALKEKERDYVAAARVSGASTPRIIFTHILPNTVAILVTLVPFSVSGIIMALTSLDYLGFGLPSDYATWGTLLRDGLANFSKPWLVTSSFTVLVITLILVTFVGEAVRDAFDPKKFTTYQ